MNCLKGKITGLEVQGNLCLVHVAVGQTPLKTIVIGPAGQQLQEGKCVMVMFKETEVILGKNADHAISLQNRFRCRIKSIESGALLSRLDMEHPEGSIVSLITSAAVRQLDLQVGEQVLAMVKTNELLLEPAIIERS